MRRAKVPGCDQVTYPPPARLHDTKGRIVFNAMFAKIAIVTGSSSGIGLLTAIELAKNGFKVVASMRDLERRTRLDEAAAAAQVTEQPDIRRLDVTDFNAIPSFVDQVIRDYGRIDVLINNAGFAVAGFAEDMKLDEIRLQFETNFFGQVAITQAVLPTMPSQSSGHIIMVSSIRDCTVRSRSAATRLRSLRWKVGANRYAWK